MENRIEFIKINFNPGFQVIFVLYFCKNIYIYENTFEKNNHIDHLRNSRVSLKLLKVRTEFGRKSFNFMAFRVPRII
jgi:hypothetical protein